MQMQEVGTLEGDKQLRGRRQSEQRASGPNASLLELITPALNDRRCTAYNIKLK